MSLLPKQIWTLLIFFSFFSINLSAQNNTCSDKEAKCEGHKTFDNGNTFDGEMAYGIPNGKGLMKFKGGDEYLGDFKEGKMHGKGAILLANGDSYHGDWANGEAEGEGTYKKKDGSSFIGTFKKGMRQGKGVVTWKNGDTLKGEWEDDKLHGTAIFEFANSDMLETKWHQGSMKVKSTYRKLDGQAINGSMNTIFMVATMEEDLADSKDEILTNLQTAWISSAMEFQANKNYDLAVDFLMAAQKYGPADSDYGSVIVQQLKAIDNTKKHNSGWAQLPKK